MSWTDFTIAWVHTCGAHVEGYLPAAVEGKYPCPGCGVFDDHNWTRGALRRETGKTEFIAAGATPGTNQGETGPMQPTEYTNHPTTNGNNGGVSATSEPAEGGSGQADPPAEPAEPQGDGAEKEEVTGTEV